MTDPICALCGWPLSTHEEKNRFCLLRPRFVAVDGKSSKENCTHDGWSFAKHGRCCHRCGAILWDAGD